MALRSWIEHVGFPAISTGVAAEILALQRQLDDSQWWPPARMREAQFTQLGTLLAHAAREVPFYAARLRDAGIDPAAFLTEKAWARIPILTRREVQTLGPKLHAHTVPPSHGNIDEVHTGGSTGVPVRVRKTTLNQLIWNALHIREMLWHADDPDGTLGRIRGTLYGISEAQQAALNSADGLVLPDWGAPTSLLWKTGKMGAINMRQPVEQQAAFLQRLQPTYLIIFPSALRILLGYFRRHGLRLPSLRAVWTISEVTDPLLREDCRDILGCGIVENYTSAETGYIATQCTMHEHLHVQSEGVLTEVLNDAGQPCKPGEVGRVVLTPLHNFAMPLIRYEIGDEAEVGSPCPCGRGLPVLTRIIGRTIDHLALPSGARRPVGYRHYHLSRIVAIQEFQVVQRTLDRVEIMLVVTRALTAEERDIVHQLMLREFGAGFQIGINIVDAIPRTASGKLRMFVCEVPSEG